jgi:hypothetical protein
MTSVLITAAASGKAAASAQLVQTRLLQAEAEAHVNEATVKLSGKN